MVWRDAEEDWAGRQGLLESDCPDIDPRAAGMAVVSAVPRQAHPSRVPSKNGLGPENKEVRGR